MELQKQKLLLVFTMFLVRATIHVASASPYSQNTLEKVEKTLLTALGIKNKPVIDRKKAHVPEAMLDLYKMQSEYESTALPLPGKLTRSANIVRSYTHQGELFMLLQIIFFHELNIESIIISIDYMRFITSF